MTRKLLAIAVLAIGLALSGCAASPSAETPNDTETLEPSEPAAPTATPLASLEELAGTKWIGTDSDGDKLTIEFTQDGTLTPVGMRDVPPIPNGWSVDGDTVTFLVDFGAGGLGTYVGVFDPATQRIQVDWTTDQGRVGTIDLGQSIY
jgi:hypothetical protein